MFELKEFQHLIAARYAVIAVETYEEIRFCQYMARLFKGREFFTWTLTEGLVQEITTGEHEERKTIANTDDFLPVLTYIKSQAEKEPEKRRIYILKDFHPGLETVIIRRALRDIANLLPQTAASIFLVSPQFKIPSDLEKAVTLVDFPLPNEEEMIARVKASILNNSSGEKARLKGKKISEDRIREIARSCLGLTDYEADNVIAKSLVKHNDYVIREIADEKKQIIRKSGLLEIYDPDIALDDLGGMEALKEYLSQVAVQADDPKAKDFGLPSPRGILLLSPPGNGKSALAKAIAHSRSLTPVRCDFGAMLGSLVGESESNLRKSLSRIDSINRCVVWLDEIEKAFPGKDAGAGDSGTSRRMLGQMLTWMQEHKSEAFIVATANSISNLPAELLRAGRFDSIWFIDLPNFGQRQQILGIHLRKRGRDWITDEHLEDIASKTEGFSGAELEQAVVNGLRIAFYRKLGKEDKGLIEAIIFASSQMRPLSQTMKEDIDALRAWAADRAQMATKPEAARKALTRRL